MSYFARSFSLACLATSLLASCGAPKSDSASDTTALRRSNSGWGGRSTHEFVYSIKQGNAMCLYHLSTTVKKDVEVNPADVLGQAKSIPNQNGRYLNVTKVGELMRTYKQANERTQRQELDAALQCDFISIWSAPMHDPGFESSWSTSGTRCEQTIRVLKDPGGVFRDCNGVDEMGGQLCTETTVEPTYDSVPNPDYNACVVRAARDRCRAFHTYRARAATEENARFDTDLNTLNAELSRSFTNNTVRIGDFLNVSEGGGNMGTLISVFDRYQKDRRFQDALGAGCPVASSLRFE